MLGLNRVLNRTLANSTDEHFPKHMSQYLNMSETRLLIFYLRTARRKARDVAVAEALCLFRDLDALAPRGGPLSEQGGLFWISLPAAQLEPAIARLPRLGYTVAVDLLELADQPLGALAISGEPSDSARTVHWRRRP